MFYIPNGFLLWNFLILTHFDFFITCMSNKNNLHPIFKTNLEFLLLLLLHETFTNWAIVSYFIVLYSNVLLSWQNKIIWGNKYVQTNWNVITFTCVCQVSKNFTVIITIILRGIAILSKLIWHILVFDLSFCWKLYSYLEKWWQCLLICSAVFIPVFVFLYH